MSAEDERAAYAEERRQRERFMIALVFAPVAAPLGVVLAMTWAMVSGRFEGRRAVEAAPVTSVEAGR